MSGARRALRATVARLVERWRGWRRSVARRRAAERALDALFQDPRRLAGSSLRPDQRPRCQLLDLSAAPERIGFGIVRHPRPYPFSRQHHAVVELWCYEPASGRLERVRGVNLTRRAGEDDASGPFAAPP
ncbi:MAG: hypothetical protein JNL90_10105 [Planctomycetes bacterium]|nr:hypothetical protein [Planctomycetota bacterium]